jgi:hypothetical protein
VEETGQEFVFVSDSQLKVFRVLAFLLQKLCGRLTFPPKQGEFGSMKSSTIHAMLFLGLVHLHAADPDFAPAPNSPFKLTNGGHSVAVGDANEDRKPDLLVCGGTNLTVLLGNGRGGFEPATNTPIALPHGAGEMAVGDFNRDGHLDWAGAHHDHYDVIVMMGKGNGQFIAAPGSPFVARAAGKKPHTHALVAGDVNGDGTIDLVTANNEDDDVSVLVGDGNGRFAHAPQSPFPAGRSPYPLALADLNGDRKLDIVAPNSAPGVRTLTVLLGDGHGGFRPAPKSPFFISGAAFFATVADINGDRKPDLIATHSGSSTITLLLGDGSGDFKPSPASPLEVGNPAWGIVAADLNQDGNPDLAAAGQNAVAVLTGDGRGAFRPVKGSPFSAGKGSWRLALADFNADSKLDIVVGNVESDDISVLLAK